MDGSTIQAASRVFSNPVLPPVGFCASTCSYAGKSPVLGPRVAVLAPLCQRGLRLGRRKVNQPEHHDMHTIAPGAYTGNFFSKKKPVTSASPIWQSADRKGLRRSLVCTTVIISSRWAFRSDGCSARGRAVADAEAGTAFRAIAIRAIAQPHEVNDKSSLSSTPSYERPYPTRFRASFLHLSLR